MGSEFVPSSLPELFKRELQAMATDNANQVILPVTKAMRLGAQTRSLPIANYIAQLCDADAAGIRALRIDAPLSSTKAAGVRRERDDDDDWRSFRNDHMPPAKKEKI